MLVHFGDTLVTVLLRAQKLLVTYFQILINLIRRVRVPSASFYLFTSKKKHPFWHFQKTVLTVFAELKKGITS